MRFISTSLLLKSNDTINPGTSCLQTRDPYHTFITT